MPNLLNGEIAAKLPLAMAAIETLLADNHGENDNRWRSLDIYGNLVHGSIHVTKAFGIVHEDEDDLLHAACRLLMAVQLREEKKLNESGI